MAWLSAGQRAEAGCEPHAGGQVVRQLQSFASYDVTWRNKTIAQGCNVGLMKDGSWSEGEAFTFCMGTSDAECRGPQALGARGLFEKTCSQQPRRPIKL